MLPIYLDFRMIVWYDILIIYTLLKVEKIMSDIIVITATTTEEHFLPHLSEIKP